MYCARVGILLIGILSLSACLKRRQRNLALRNLRGHSTYTCGSPAVCGAGRHNPNLRLRISSLLDRIGYQIRTLGFISFTLSLLDVELIVS